MNIDSARLICFSPTGTTRKVLDGIAAGLGAGEVQCLDLTLPETQKQKVVDLNGELALIGSPVYAGRLPAEMIFRMETIRGNGAPAVIVVVYGNRAYEDALIELRNIAVEAGFRPVAAAAFVGEHSYSTDAAPIAAGRPDADDLGKASAFGRVVREKLNALRSPDEIGMLKVPGNFPYKKRSLLSNIAPVTFEETCVKCGECATACPTAAITVGESITTDASACIRCCACVRSCANGARVMADQRIRQAAERLSAAFHERKEPETHL